MPRYHARAATVSCEVWGAIPMNDPAQAECWNPQTVGLQLLRIGTVQIIDNNPTFLTCMPMGG